MRGTLRKVAAALALLAALGYFLVSAEQGEGLALIDWIRDPAGSRARQEAYLEGERPAEGPLGSRRGALAPAAPSAGLPEDAGGEQAAVSGRVLELDGSPVPGLVVAAPFPQRGVATTDGAGAFALPLASPDSRIEVASQGWIVLGSQEQVSPTGRGQWVLVVAEGMALEGYVTDATGQPIEAAQVLAFTPLALAASEELASFLPERFERQTLTDAAGHFRLDELPSLPFLRIDASKPGYVPVRRAAPDEPERELVELVLEREGGGDRR